MNHLNEIKIVYERAKNIHSYWSNIYEQIDEAAKNDAEAEMKNYHNAMIENSTNPERWTVTYENIYNEAYRRRYAIQYDNLHQEQDRAYEVIREKCNDIMNEYYNYCNISKQPINKEIIEIANKIYELTY